MNQILVKVRYGYRGKTRCVINVLFFSRLKDLRKYARKHSTEKSRDLSEAAGCYVGLESKKYFGLICLWEEIVGAGYFAHELQHFVFDYIAREMSDNLSDVNEKLAWMVGDMTAQFWAKYYKLYPEKGQP